MANFQMSLVGEGLLKPGAMRAWTRERQQQLYSGATRAMREQGRPMAKAANDQARSAMNIKRKSFPNFKSKVYTARKDIPPVLRIYSGVPWLGMHSRNSTITADGRNRMLIPLIRIGYWRFKVVVSTILRNGAGFWKEINGKVFLFAEYQAEYGQPLARFRRFERANRGGQRIRNGDDIPIAMLVTRVQVKKRIDVERAVRPLIPNLVTAIEREAARG